ncbi:hypothetical protein HP456_03695 [Bacillus haikouensis]|uniref:hypothetical protein n=1 Tax=Bacillus haikouensis TaxID=1510468 RepID=UPI001553C075|nr:hypothetical protein [Bacillus haikouensis]NQD65017.1 hypothetical protein [Bacillus haikouensis]
MDEDTTVSLTSETMKEIIDSLGMNIRQSALEIGIAHTTLSRYIRKENKRQNKNNDAKMLNWLHEKAKSKGPGTKRINHDIKTNNFSVCS